MDWIKIIWETISSRARAIGRTVAEFFHTILDYAGFALRSVADFFRELFGHDIIGDIRANRSRVYLIYLGADSIRRQLAGLIEKCNATWSLSTGYVSVKTDRNDTIVSSDDIKPFQNSTNDVMEGLAPATQEAGILELEI